MKRTLLTIIALLACTLAVRAESIKVNGAFTGIDVSSSIDVVIHKSSKSYAKVTFNPELKPYIVAKVSSGELRLYVDTEKMRKTDKKLYKTYNSGRNNEEYKIEVDAYMDRISSIDASGLSSIRIRDDFHVDNDLEIDLSGVAGLEAGKFTVSSDFALEMSGASVLKMKELNVTLDSEIELSGSAECNIGLWKTNNYEMDNSGASTLEIEELDIAGDAETEMSGAALCKVGVLKVGKLSVDNSGAAVMQVKTSVINNLYADLSGSARLNIIAGEGRTGVVVASGASYLAAKGFKMQSASVKGTGAARIAVNATDIEIDISNSVSLEIPNGANVRMVGASNIKRF